jgi:hypothetical protein
MSSSLVRGATAGAVGTLALGGFALLRNAVLGHTPPYAARRIAARLVGRALHRPVGPRAALAWSLGLRCTYGPLLGLAWSRVRAALPSSPVARGLLLGAGVWALEHLTFPLLRATPPPRTWTRAEKALLLTQTLLFGLVTERWWAVMESRLALSIPPSEVLAPPLSQREREPAARPARGGEAL